MRVKKRRLEEIGKTDVNMRVGGWVEVHCLKNGVRDMDGWMDGWISQRTVPQSRSCG